MAHGWLLYNLVQGHNADLKREVRKNDQVASSKRTAKLQSVRKR